MGSASPTGWRVWLGDLAQGGKARLGKLGLTLVIGFVAALLALGPLEAVGVPERAATSGW